jgi:hypothetical protein
MFAVVCCGIWRVMRSVKSVVLEADRDMGPSVLG